MSIFSTKPNEIPSVNENTLAQSTENNLEIKAIK